MRGLKKLMTIANGTTDIQTLLKIRQHLHCQSDIAALNDDARGWNRICEAESAVVDRITKLKGGAK